MQLKDILPHLIYEFKHESDLLKAIEELSAKFTTNREQIGDYLKDPRLTAAYTAFYLSTNIPKFKAVLKWMPEAWLAMIKSLPLVDVGAGPGTFSLAFKEWSGPAFKEVIQIETSGPMRDQAQKLWQGLYTDKLTQTSAPVEASGSFMLFGHSANEMGSELAMRYIDKVNPDHLLFIEPGTKDFFPKMLEIREALKQRNFHVLYPCPSFDKCPMANSSKDWCHQFIQVRHDPEVERLSQILHLDRKLMPLTVHAYSKIFNHQDEQRLVRVHPDTKYSYEWDVCQSPELHRYQIFKRGFDKKTLKDLDGVLAGASVLIETEKVLEKGKRGKLRKLDNKIFES